MKEHFINALENLKIMLFTQAAQIDRIVYLAVNAVGELNTGDALSIVDGDRQIDLEEIRIEEECLKILALHQPVAGDLRQVITVLKINNELERIGDLAVNIAERVPNMATFADCHTARFDFTSMAEQAGAMLRESLTALRSGNVAAAEEVIRLDDAVDALHRENYIRVREMLLLHPDTAQYYMDCLTVSRCLERIADIATNIGEDIIYQTNGKIVRHAPPVQK